MSPREVSNNTDIADGGQETKTPVNRRGERFLDEPHNSYVWHVIITLGFSHEHRLLISRRCSLSHKRGQGIALKVSSARKVSSEVITYTMKYTTYT